MVRKKKRNKKTKNEYFLAREENAVVAYNISTSEDEKKAIYSAVLKKPFSTMAEIIYKRYHANDYKGGLEMEEIIHNAITHVFENLHKFDPNAKSKKNGGKTKAFSYFQTVIRNYYRDHGKLSYKKLIKHLSFEDHYEDIENSGLFTYEIDSTEEYELKQRLIDAITNKIRQRISNDGSLKKNEIIVGEAIIKVFVDWHSLFLEETNQGQYGKKISNNFTKQKILLYLKEITNLSTKEIRASMKQFKELYFFEKNEFFKNE